MNNIFYIFIDESGNLDFSSKGTKFFVLTAFTTCNPVIGRERFLTLKYQLLAQGIEQEYFHATEDRQSVRNLVYEHIISLKDTFEIYSVVAQKSAVTSELYKEVYIKKGRTIVRSTGTLFYQRVCQTLLKDIFKEKSSSIENIVIVLGLLFVGDKKKVVLKTIKESMKRNFPGTPFEIYCHSSRSDINSQLADYCSWAIAIRRERGESRPYDALHSLIKSEFEMFS